MFLIRRQRYHMRMRFMSWRFLDDGIGGGVNGVHHTAVGRGKVQHPALVDGESMRKIKVYIVNAMDDFECFVIDHH